MHSAQDTCFSTRYKACLYFTIHHEYKHHVNRFINWCKANSLDLNTSKTKEMIIDFRNRKPMEPSSCPMNINGANVEIMDSYKYLGTVINDTLKWEDNCRDLYKKGQQRLYFLRKLNSFHVDRSIMHLFYKAIIESILVHECVVWFTACRKADLSLLKRIVRQAEKILRVQLHFEDLCKSRIVDKAKSIIGNELHPLNDNYVVLRSGNRLRSVRCRTSRFLDSFVRSSIRILNEGVTNLR